MGSGVGFDGVCGRLGRRGGHRSVAAGDPVIAAAGDIACDPTDSDFHGGTGTSSSCQQRATSDLINSDSSISAVLALGDNQYGCGGLTAYQKSFALSWGRFLSKIHPTPETMSTKRAAAATATPLAMPRATSATSERARPATPTATMPGIPGRGT